MERKTIMKIVKAITGGDRYTTRIKGYYYDIEYDRENDIVVVEGRTAKTRALSTCGADAYSYTHGGSIYRESQDLCWEVEEELRKFFAGVEPEEELKKYYSYKHDKEISIPVKTCSNCGNRFDEELEELVDSETIDVDTAIDASLCKKCSEL